MDAAPTHPAPARARDAMPRGVKGWWRFGRTVWEETSADQVLLLAAGVAFFAFVSIFPTLLATGLVYGLVTDNPDEVRDQVAQISDVLPEGAEALIVGQLERLVMASDESLSMARRPQPATSSPRSTRATTTQSGAASSGVGRLRSS